MATFPGFVNLLPAVPVLIAHLAGVVVAAILLTRHREKSLPAVLALIGFALLLLVDVANLARGPVISLVSHRTRAGVRFAVASVGCCCSLLDAAAAISLAVAIWQALSGRLAQGAG